MLLAADWQNPLDRLDVNADGMLAPIDALVISNQLPAVRGSGEEAGGYIGYPDVNGDGVVDETDMNTVVAYVNTMPTSSSGGSSTAPSSSSTSSASSSSSSSSMYGGISLSAPTTLTVNEAQQFELTFSWTNAYWIVIEAPGLSFGSVIEPGYYAMMDSNPDPFVFQSYVGNTTAGQATLTAAFPDDGVSPGNGTASDVMPITITAYGYYNMSAAQTTDVTVNNVDPVLTTTLLTPSTIEEGDEAQIEIHWSDAYWYEGETDRLTLEIDWGEGAGSQAVDFASLQGCNSGNPFIGCSIAKHVYLDDNPTNTASDPYTIAITLSDDDTGSVTNTIPLTVNNADPVVTIDSITIINRVSEATGGKNDRIDESEGFIVTGYITDKGILDTQTATIEADWNFDDVISLDEIIPLALVADPQVPGKWTFSHTVDEVLDDEAEYDSAGNVVWGNNTAQDSLAFSVKVIDDDTGIAGAAQDVTVYNVGPSFVDDPNVSDDQPSVSFAFDGNGKLISATLNAEFSDPGTLDFHRIGIIWGDGGEGDGTMNPIQFDPGILQVTIIRQFDPSSDVNPDSLYPIIVELSDDDLGFDAWLIRNEPCGCDVAAPGSTSHALRSGGSGQSQLAKVQLQPAQPQIQNPVTATTFTYNPAPAASNLHTMGFQFGWQMTFDNTAANLVGFQEIAYIMWGWDKYGRLVHRADFDAVDLIRLQPPGSPHAPFFADTQSTIGKQQLFHDWVVDDGVCSFTFRRVGNMFLTQASGVQIVKNGVSAPYNPTTDIEGMVLSNFTVDGVLVEGGSTSTAGVDGPNIGDSVHFVGPPRYHAMWVEAVNTTVKWVGPLAGRYTEYKNIGGIHWRTSADVFPEKPQIAPNIDISKIRVGNNP